MEVWDDSDRPNFKVGDKILFVREDGRPVTNIIYPVTAIFFDEAADRWVVEIEYEKRRFRYKEPVITTAMRLAETGQST